MLKRLVTIFIIRQRCSKECNQLTWASNLGNNVKLKCSLLVWSHFLRHLFRRYVKIILNSYKLYLICWPCVIVDFVVLKYLNFQILLE